MAVQAYPRFSRTVPGLDSGQNNKIGRCAMPHLFEVLFGFGGLAVCALVMILIGNLSRPSARELNDSDQATRSGRARAEHFVNL
jgi:hypothetical protein